MKISVIIPTYKRVQSLERCLEAIQLQSRYPDEIIIVVRDTDAETIRFLQSYSLPSIRLILVSSPGQVAALNLGIESASGDIVAITDDDTAPFETWLERIELHFNVNPKVGGVGGRDWVYHGGILEDGYRKRVGCVRWYGRVIGNHHLCIKGIREVDILKGANMSYRKAALGIQPLDTLLKGQGAQVHNDMALSLSLRRKGWKLIYDPDVAVKHFPAERFDEDRRNEFNIVALHNAVHNETYIFLKCLPAIKTMACLLWAILIGKKSTPGLIQFIRILPGDKNKAWLKFLATMKGRFEGWKTWRAYKKNAERMRGILDEAGTL